MLFLKDDDRRREDVVGDDSKDDDDDDDDLVVDPTRGLVSTNETRDGELQHRREHGTSSFFSNDTTTNNGFGIHWCFPRWTRDVRKERRRPRIDPFRGSGWRCVCDIDRSLALHFRPSLTTRSSRERDDDATQGCVLIECSNAFFQKREVFERTRVLTFFHLFLSLSFSLAMYSTRPHRHSTTRQRKTMWKQSSL